MFTAVTGRLGGKNNTVLMNSTHTTDTQFTAAPHRPSVNGPSTNLTSLRYSWCARMTATYDRSRAGAVMLKIAVAVSVEPIAMQVRRLLKTTTNQTALMGVWVYGFTWERNLSRAFGSGWLILGIMSAKGRRQRGHARGEW